MCVFRTRCWSCCVRLWSCQFGRGRASWSPASPETCGRRKSTRPRSVCSVCVCVCIMSCCPWRHLQSIKSIYFFHAVKNSLAWNWTKAVCDHLSHTTKSQKAAVWICVSSCSKTVHRYWTRTVQIWDGKKQVCANWFICIGKRFIYLLY